MSDDVIDPNPALDDALILSLVYDMAAKIHPPAEIAQRYGFGGIQGLYRYLANHPGVVENVKKLRATFHSERGAEERVRLKGLLATEDLIPMVRHIAADPRVGAQQRIDAFKQLSRVAAVDGSAAAAAQKAAGGAAFTLNILFRDQAPEKLAFVTSGAPANEPDRKSALPDELLHGNNEGSLRSKNSPPTNYLDDPDDELEEV